mgnify:CR=1 FL=1
MKPLEMKTQDIEKSLLAVAGTDKFLKRLHYFVDTWAFRDTSVVYILMELMKMIESTSENNKNIYIEQRLDGLPITTSR